VHDQETDALLYYVHDPMCSWCWGFVPVLEDFLGKLPKSIRVRRLLGGLAADSDYPMPAALQQTIKAAWQRIEQAIPGTVFNYDFWTQCAPRRSTWPSCRAVIAARLQGEEFDVRMTRAIQLAYYTQAHNPADEDTLVELAGELGLNTQIFTGDLRSEPVARQLQAEIALARRLQASSFPSLVLRIGTAVWHIPVDYNDSAPMLELVTGLTESPDG
jgi:putative protein-disulfide isomerase